MYASTHLHAYIPTYSHAYLHTAIHIHTQTNRRTYIQRHEATNWEYAAYLLIYTHTRTHSRMHTRAHQEQPDTPILRWLHPRTYIRTRITHRAGKQNSESAKLRECMRLPICGSLEHLHSCIIICVYIYIYACTNPLPRPRVPM